MMASISIEKIRLTLCFDPLILRVQVVAVLIFPVFETPSLYAGVFIMFDDEGLQIEVDLTKGAEGQPVPRRSNRKAPAAI